MQGTLSQWSALQVMRLPHPICKSYRVYFLLPSLSFLYMCSTLREVVELNQDTATAADLINSMIAAWITDALLGGISYQLFRFRETVLGAAVLAILGFLFYKMLVDNF